MVASNVDEEDVVSTTMGTLHKSASGREQAKAKNLQRTVMATDNADSKKNAPTGEAMQSQPMSKTASSSSFNSAKVEESDAFAQPYGTRSRSRPGPRPNYTDEPDVDFEPTPSTKSETASSKRSTPLEANPKVSKTNGEAEAGSRASFQMNGSQSHSSDYLPKSEKLAQSSPGGEDKLKRKKRKYERSNVTKTEYVNGSGTTNLSAQPNNTTDNTPEPPPNKKRRMQAADVQSASRKIIFSSSSGAFERVSPLITFQRSGARLKNDRLEADDGSSYAVNDYVYLVCEPPGDPYYLCRIMEFRHSISDDPKSPVRSFLVNWFFRPRDIGRYHSDPRYLYASMQSDESPLTSLRGKCQIKHRSQISDFEQYRKRRDTFWFNQLFDRYIQRPYEIIPTSSVINVPEKVKQVMDKRWQFLVVEPARQKELTSAVKLCKRCRTYCAPDNSVDCGVCRNTYHMTCVRPPLAKKPSRGFAWSCGPCSRAREKRLEQRHTAIITPETGTDQDDIVEEEEEEEEAGTIIKAPTDNAHDAMHLDESPSQSDIKQVQMWPWRYLGIHCKVEDILQYDDRAIYPRASSRLGPRHQANVGIWPGQPVELIKSEVKRKYVKGGAGNKKDAKLSKETQAALEAEKAAKANRPKWQQDAPPGYVARGEDYANDDERCTAQRLFVMPEDTSEDVVDDYMKEVKSFAKDIAVAREVYPTAHTSESKQEIVPTNLLQKALSVLMKQDFNSDSALKGLRTMRSPKDFGDPEFTKEELKRFEDGVTKHGSDLRNVRKLVKTRTHGEIVRFYYNWKKTTRGQDIWGNHDSRKGTHRGAETSWTDIADDEDDSAFDNDKSVTRKRRFHCKFCQTRTSRQWRRAPNVAPGATVLADPKGSAREKANQLVVALCHRCALIWRKYAVKYEDTEEIAKSITQSGTRAWKRKNEEEMLREFVLANEAARVYTGPCAASVAKSLGVTVTVPHPDELVKKSKIDQATVVEPKKKAITVPVREPSPELVPNQPFFRQLPCAICRNIEPSGDRLVYCRECRLSVHRKCYGIPDHANASKWICDTCMNDKNGSCSFSYKCISCPVVDRELQMITNTIRPPKKTKTEKEKEREAKEKKLVEEMASDYRKSQDKRGKPRFPREAVKRTANNNWMHIVCSTWTPDIKFLNAEKLDFAEGMAAAMVTSSVKSTECKICKLSDEGLLIACQQCHASFHAGCAHEAEYIFGFDIVPVKGSRKDVIPVVTLGNETGAMTAAVWCKDHQIKTIVHDINEICAETGLTALQTYVRTYKQAETGSSTGNARRALIMSQASKHATTALTPTSGNTIGSRRSSVITNGVAKSALASSPIEETPASCDSNFGGSKDELCSVCASTCTLKWFHEEAMQNERKKDPFEALLNREPKLQSLEGKITCHKCHSLVASGKHAASINAAEKDQYIDDSVARPDYFEITAPPPAVESLPPPPQIVQKPTGVQQPWPPLANQHPQAESGEMAATSDENVERWTRDLAACSVRMINPQNETYTFRGADFSLNEDRNKIFQSIVDRAVEKLGMNIHTQLIVAEEGQPIGSAGELMSVLVRIVQDRRLDSNWHIVERPTDVMQRGPDHHAVSSSIFRPQQQPPPPKQQSLPFNVPPQAPPRGEYVAANGMHAQPPPPPPSYHHHHHHRHQYSPSSPVGPHTPHGQPMLIAGPPHHHQPHPPAQHPGSTTAPPPVRYAPTPATSAQAMAQKALQHRVPPPGPPPPGNHSRHGSASSQGGVPPITSLPDVPPAVNRGSTYCPPAPPGPPSHFSHHPPASMHHVPSHAAPYESHRPPPPPPLRRPSSQSPAARFNQVVSPMYPPTLTARTSGSNASGRPGSGNPSPTKQHSFPSTSASPATPIHPPVMPVIPAAQAAAPAAPSTTTTTTTTTGGSASASTGASQSPNLRNLMH